MLKTVLLKAFIFSWEHVLISWTEFSSSLQKAHRSGMKGHTSIIITNEKLFFTVCSECLFAQYLVSVFFGVEKN